MKKIISFLGILSIVFMVFFNLSIESEKTEEKLIFNLSAAAKEANAVWEGEGDPPGNRWYGVDAHGVWRCDCNVAAPSGCWC